MSSEFSRKSECFCRFELHSTVETCKAVGAARGKEGVKGELFEKKRGVLEDRGGALGGVEEDEERGEAFGDEGVGVGCKMEKALLDMCVEVHAALAASHKVMIGLPSGIERGKAVAPGDDFEVNGLFSRKRGEGGAEGLYSCVKRRE